MDRDVENLVDQLTPEQIQAIHDQVWLADLDDPGPLAADDLDELEVTD